MEPTTPDGLAVVDDDAEDLIEDEPSPEPPPAGDCQCESLRDRFVEAFNDRDLEELVELVGEDVALPDGPGHEGVAALADECIAWWERSPGAILTRGHLDEEVRPCAVAWLPDEDGCWARAGLLLFDCDDQGVLAMVAAPHDADALARAVAEDPTGEELEEWRDWGEYDTGAETAPAPRR